MPSFLIAGSPAAVAEAVAGRVEGVAAEAVTARGRWAVALPGGSVAATCFPRLVTATLDWSRAEVFFGDERAVPPDAPDSNFGLARRLLLSHVPLSDDHVYRMAAEPASLDAAAAGYARTLASVLGDPPVLDLVLLGVGEDGHVCSVFPGPPTPHAAEGWVAAVREAPKPPPDRLTLTLATLVAARHVMVVAMGTAKAAAIRAALEDAASTLPVARVARAARDVRFILDAGAASALGHAPSA
ncbi:MAG TPA: 6-phosphogluconolactonase [Vicinamibacterales bacterium]|nr:6-phosphogluconolactonase [Vicinamibacterales bacterium]